VGSRLQSPRSDDTDCPAPLPPGGPATAPGAQLAGVIDSLESEEAIAGLSEVSLDAAAADAAVHVR